jgi:hypothetical protein
LCEYIGAIGPSKWTLSKKDNLTLVEDDSSMGGFIALTSTDFANESRYIRALPFKWRGKANCSTCALRVSG